MPVLAVPVEDLYVADVYVTAENDAQRLSGARAGLLQVLTRVSGHQNITDNETIRVALRNPTRFYYQYSYQPTDRSFQVGNQVLPGRILRINFEPNAIAGLLREAGFPVWGSNRPSVLLWVVVSQDNGRKILTENDALESSVAIQELARERGLPLFYPLMDLEDASSLSPAEIWGAFLERVEGASARYNPDSILSGRIQPDTGDQWRGTWAFQIDGNWRRFESVAGTKREVIADVVNEMANQLASRYAVGSARSAVTLRIENVSSVEAYASILKYLQSLAPVLDTSVVSLEGTDLTLELSTEGQQQQLIEIVELDQKMTLLNDAGGRLLYRWLP